MNFTRRCRDCGIRYDVETNNRRCGPVCCPPCHQKNLVEKYARDTERRKRTQIMHGIGYNKVLQAVDAAAARANGDGSNTILDENGHETTAHTLAVRLTRR